jgi:hypothetical protein
MILHNSASRPGDEASPMHNLGILWSRLNTLSIVQQQVARCFMGRMLTKGAKDALAVLPAAGMPFDLQSYDPRDDTKLRCSG